MIDKNELFWLEFDGELSGPFVSLGDAIAYRDKYSCGNHRIVKVYEIQGEKITEV
jgi:hypothetical protein